jgi:hypothetical protein
VCGNSVLFEPAEKELPILKTKYRAIERLSEWRPNKDERAWLRAAGVHGYRGVKQGVKEQPKASSHRGIGEWFAGLMGGSRSASQASNGKQGLVVGARWCEFLSVFKMIMRLLMACHRHCMCERVRLCAHIL